MLKALDRVVRKNAANAEEISSASEELSAQAQQMKYMADELTALAEGRKTKGRHPHGKRHFPKKQAEQKYMELLMPQVKI